MTADVPFSRPRHPAEQPGDAVRAPQELLLVPGPIRDDRTWRLVWIRIQGEWRSGLLTVWRQPSNSRVWLAHVRWGEDRQSPATPVAPTTATSLSPLTTPSSTSPTPASTPSTAPSSSAAPSIPPTPAVPTTTPPAASTPTAASNTANGGMCSIHTNEGGCYKAGEFCRKSDVGKTTTDAQGRTITCGIESGQPHWHY